MELEVTITVNGTQHTLNVPSLEPLVDTLRDRLGLTGTHKDCTLGICGCCTVLMNGEARTSCLTLTAQADGAQITTVEGLERDGRLHALQEAFLRHGAVQCGFCTPGFLMTAKGLLDHNPKPNREEIADALRGNICRCTGYVKIIDAVQAASEVLDG